MYGCHFNKKLYEWAVSKMTDRNGGDVTPKTKEQVDEMLASQGVTVKNNVGYDLAYIHAMAMSDYYGSSIVDDAHLAKFIKDFADDPDGNPCKAFDHFVVDRRAKGEPIFWDMML